MGLDEASLDVSDAISSTGTVPRDLAESLRRRVKEATEGLTCSVGIAANRTLAKVCSDLPKPDGVFELGGSLEEIRAFVSTLPVRKVPGVGKVSEGCEKNVWRGEGA